MADIHTPITLGDNATAITILQHMRAELASLTTQLGDSAAAAVTIGASVTIAEIDSALASILLLGVAPEDVTFNSLTPDGDESSMYNVREVGATVSTGPLPLSLLTASTPGYLFSIYDSTASANKNRAVVQSYVPYNASQGVTVVQVIGDGTVTDNVMSTDTPALPALRTKCTGIPPGTVVPYLGSTTPPGWIFCDGTAATGANLLIIQAALGGATSLDMRGMVPRVHDASHAVDSDPRYTTLAQTTPSSAPLSVQNDAMFYHTHASALAGALPGLVMDSWYKYIPAQILYYTSTGTTQANMYTTAIASFAGGTTNTHTMTISGTATETEPPSVIVNYIMKL